MQRLKFVPVRFNAERTVLCEFILLAEGVTLWSTETPPYNGRSERALQQFGVHHWSGAGREVSFLSSNCTEYKLTTSGTNKFLSNTLLMCNFPKTPSEFNTFAVFWAKPRPHPCIGPLTMLILDCFGNSKRFLSWQVNTTSLHAPQCLLHKNPLRKCVCTWRGVWLMTGPWITNTFVVPAEWVLQSLTSTTVSLLK